MLGVQYDLALKGLRLVLAHMRADPDTLPSQLERVYDEMGELYAGRCRDLVANVCEAIEDGARTVEEITEWIGCEMKMTNEAISMALEDHAVETVTCPRGCVRHFLRDER